MSKTTAKLVVLIVALSLVGLFSWLMIAGAAYLLTNWRELDKSVAFLALAAIVSLLISARILASGPWRAVALKHRHDALEQRRNLYLRLLAESTSDSHTTVLGTVAEKLSVSEFELALIADPAVINAYLEFRHCALNNDKDVGPALASWINTMRKDLGIQSHEVTHDFLSALTAMRSKASNCGDQ